jgi:hypothetical protein
MINLYTKYYFSRSNASSVTNLKQKTKYVLHSYYLKHIFDKGMAETLVYFLENLIQFLIPTLNDVTVTSEICRAALLELVTVGN